jgi:sugar/nucleoside kinase (ribokinase family)
LPAYPVEEVHDPTGAGDSFAGGFVGYLAKHGDLGFEAMHRALLAGTVCASFTVEAFSVDRLRQLSHGDIERRCRELERIAGWSWSSRLVPQG